MLEELGMNPRSSGARSWGRRPGEEAGTGGGRVALSFSTGIANAWDAASTGRSGRVADGRAG